MTRRTLPGAEGEPLRGYAPLVLVVAALAIVIGLFPSRAGDPLAEGRATGGEVGPEPGAEERGQTATGWGTAVSPCPDRDRQVEGDGYSPPCFTFDGDNGGATTPGVTAEEITVGYRVTAGPNFLATYAAAAGIAYDESDEDWARTTEGLAEYFNANFQLYGRRLRVERVEGQGSVVEEIFGAGQAEANNDALRASAEAEVFADMSAFSQPYAEALSRQGIVNFGAPYMSREWFERHSPYAWSLLTDCSVIAETGSEYMLQRLTEHPARFAGGDLAGQPRKVAVIAPDNPEYQQCVAASNDVVQEAGSQYDLILDYNLDLATLQPQAATLLGRLQNQGITTVACACDPSMLLFLTRGAEAQGYQPEWQVLGAGFTDLDLVAQGYATDLSGDQWSRAFGISYAAEPVPFQESPGYRAYRSARDDEPSQFVGLIYHQLYSLVIGIQMAGPELTPESFEAGMFTYPGGSGVAGTWEWGPGRHTPQVDAREVWWDPGARSPFNDQIGAYVGRDQRFRPGEWPGGEPEVFGR